MINLEREDDVFILTMDSGENRWNTNFVRAFDATLDEVVGSRRTGRNDYRVEQSEILFQWA